MHLKIQQSTIHKIEFMTNIQVLNMVWKWVVGWTDGLFEYDNELSSYVITEIDVFTTKE